MSGGHFNYSQYRIHDIEQEIRELIAQNEASDYPYSEETISEFWNAVIALRTAAIYAQRIDWLVSGDDGEDSFHKRLKYELEGAQFEMERKMREVK